MSEKRQTGGRRACHDERRDRRLRTLLPLHAQPRRPLRRLLLRRRHLDRDLLPAELPGAAPAPPQRAPVRRPRPPRRPPGLRACKRCEPDAAPGSPAWNRRADVAGRAFRLIADGSSIARASRAWPRAWASASASSTASWWPRSAPGPAQLARAQRAQAARTLIESTGAELRRGRVGCGLRQHPPVQRHDPGDLRAHAQRAAPPGPAQPRRHRRRARWSCACPARAPLDGRCAAGASSARGRSLASRTSRTGPTAARSRSSTARGLVALTPEADAVRCVLRLDDLRDLTAAVARCRRLLDLDADPVSIAGAARGRPGARRGRRRRPGMRVPGTVDGFELAVRAIVGQQVSVPAARTVLGRLVERYGERLPEPDGPITHRFPTAEALAELDPGRPAVPAPARRGAALARAAGRRPRGCASTPAPTRPPRSRRCSTSPAWARGPRRMSRCARSATRTRSWPATSASGTRSGGSASPPRARALRRSPSPGGPGAPTPSCTCGR